MKRSIRIVGVGCAAAAIFGGWWLITVIRDLPDPALVAAPRVNESTKILDRTGIVTLYEIYGEEKRTVLAAEQIPDVLRMATIAVEDAGFYTHGALDFRAVVRAFLANIAAGRIAEGGSTISQQLAKISFLRPEKTLTRKIKELALALRLERRYSKDEILTLYLNSIPYGANAYGAEAAGRTYFGKGAQELSLAEAALLAALPRAPSYYSPYGAHRDELLARKNTVLRAMAALGYITDDEAKRAQKESLAFLPPRTVIRAPHFSLAVQDYLNTAYGEEFVRSGGLRVITTLDLSLQDLAEQVVSEGAGRNEELYQGKNAALIAENPLTGEVLALVGSRDYFDEAGDGNFNVALQGLRQPGSALKPFVYLAAFERGFTPDTVVWDVETEFDTTRIPEQSYIPSNFDEVFRGPVTLRSALAQSINIPAIKTLYLAGLDQTLRRLADLGITTLDERGRYSLSLVLGGGEVRLNELVHAYSALAADGMRTSQKMILKISYRDENGRERVLEKADARTQRVIAPNYARIINDILADKEARAPLFKNSLSLTVFPGYDVTLKTGTSNDYRDAWAIGYTPSLAAGVWAGNNNNAPMQRHAGSILAAVPLWSAFMRAALASSTPASFPRPEPLPAPRPMLRGNYLSEGPRSVLYYLQKRDPQGPTPAAPESDPQFRNWEEGIARFLDAHPDFLKNPPALTPSAVENEASVVIRAPVPGAFVNDVFAVSADITSPQPLAKAELYLNGGLVETMMLGGAQRYALETIIRSPRLELQNTLVLVAVRENGARSETSSVFYRATP